jgi:hypothetical protein
MTGFARVVLCAVTLATATTACAQNSKQDKQAADAIAKGLGSPLAGFASQRIIVLPVQLLRGDSLSWIQPSGWTAFRTELDDSVASAISERGIGKGWAYPADVVRQAKRNAGYVGDPYSIGAQPLRGQNYRPADHIPPLMASNLRAMIALGDARYALIPVELVFQRDAARQRAVLRLALVDGRTGQFAWVGEVASDPATDYSPSILSMIAARVADLVVAR